MPSSKQPAIVIDQAVLGGISDSIYMGKPNSLAAIVGFNLHKVPGLMLVNQRMTQISPPTGPAVVDDLVKSIQCSDGIKRLFGKTSGKIWEIDQNGAFTQPAVIPVISDALYPTTVVNDNSVGSTPGLLVGVAVNAGGSGYTLDDLLTIAGGTGGQVTVDSIAVAGQLKTAVLNAGGTGYIVGDLLSITGGGGTGGIITVNTVDGAGKILTYTLTAQGSGYANTTGAAITGGTGTGATFNLTIYATGAVLTISLAAEGTGYSVTTGAATSGGAGTGATINITSVNTMDWISPANVEVEDETLATFTTGPTQQLSHYLKTTGYGFAIPNGATITGVIVEVKRYLTQNDPNNNTWEAVYMPISLVKGGSIQGTTTSGPDHWYSQNQYTAKGGPQDMWGITLTPTDVNASNFGVAFAVQSTNAIANVDAIRIRVCYTVNGKGAGVFDAKEYYGNVYYATSNYVGQYELGNPITTRVDNFGEFQNGDTFFHPMIVQNLVLFIGDGNVVAQVDSSGLPFAATAFSPAALKIIPDERVSCLGKQTTNLLVGSKNINGLNLCAVYNWDTFSRSFNQIDSIPENGVNSFMVDKLRMIISVGENGNFYEYVRSFYGQYLQPLEQIPPNYPQLFDSTNKGGVYHTAVDYLQNIPIFGFSRFVGNPALQGLYTLGARDSSYPAILTLEYPVSTNKLNNITIWSVMVVGNDIYMSMKDETDPQNPIYSFDKLDTTKKIQGAYFDTMIMKYTKTLMDMYRDFVVGYDQLPDNTSIDFYYNKNKEGWVKLNTTEEPNEFVADKNPDGETDRHMYKATQSLQGRTIQFRVVVNSNNNDAPNIEDVTMLLGG